MAKTEQEIGWEVRAVGVLRQTLASKKFQYKQTLLICSRVLVFICIEILPPL